MISYYSNVAYSMRRYSMINIKYYYTFIYLFVACVVEIQNT